MVDDILEIAAKNGDRALFERLHQMAAKEPDQRQRRRLLGAMSSFRDPTIVKDSLPIMLSSEFDMREAMALLRGTARAPETRQLAYDFVKANFDGLAARLPLNGAAELPSFGVPLCSEQARADVDRFFRGRSTKLEGGPRRLEQALERTHLCAEFKAAQGPSVAQFFEGAGTSGQH
jgi:alanyl aminopeptidase